MRQRRVARAYDIDEVTSKVLFDLEHSLQQLEKTALNPSS